MQLTKEMARLILLQIAGFAALFSGFSSRISAGVALLQRLASPDVWDTVWGLVGPTGTATAGGAAGAAATTSPDRFNVGPANDDAFGWIDEVAAAREEWEGEGNEQPPSQPPQQPQGTVKKS